MPIPNWQVPFYYNGIYKQQINVVCIIVLFLKRCHDGFVIYRPARRPGGSGVV